MVETRHIHRRGLCCFQHESRGEEGRPLREAEEEGGDRVEGEGQEEIESVQRIPPLEWSGTGGLSEESSRIGGRSAAAEKGQIFDY